MQKMQKNSTAIINDVNCTENQYTRINIPSHGQIPKWLEDMTNNVKKDTPLADYQNYPELFLNMNEKTGTPELDDIDISLQNSASSSSQIKHGRRAGTYNGSPVPPSSIKKIPEDFDDYFVPNMNDIDLNSIDKSKNKTMTYEEYYRNFKENLNKQKSSKKDDANQNLNNTDNNYSPSLLENGRRSRLDHISDNFNELIASLSQTQHEQVVPDKFYNSHQPKANNKTVDNKLSDNKLANKLDDSKLSSLSNDMTSKLIFDESFKSNRIQKNRRAISTPNKRMRYKKFKYKQGSSSKKDMRYADITKNTNRKLSESQIEIPEELFIIPELPSGTKMVINILSTWGDKYYVGLNGIELFESDGKIANVKKIKALDINVLPECSDDPRVVTNLLDGINRTHDDRHLWLAPFESGKNQEIFIEFEKHTVVAMMRIWNYNKSRIHSYRGARYVIITLDDVIIFKGEIAQACGSISGSIESFGDTILFTTNEPILEKISYNDEAFASLISAVNYNESERVDRPTTATKPEEFSQRPYTHAFIKQPEKDETESNLIGTYRIDLVLILNWGRPDSIGLTGLEIVGESGSIMLTEKNILCNYHGPIIKLIDGENITTDPKHMWSVKYVDNIVLSIVFDEVTYISGIRIWNYNESIESSFIGVRAIKIFFDGKLLLNSQDSTFILRRAPGNVHYDFVQEVDFIRNVKLSRSEAVYDFQNFGIYKHKEEQAVMPEGFVFQIVIYTTWGDQYYVGLNGLELFDHLGRKIILSENNICAHPESVNVLPNVSGDIRTPDKLIDGINDSLDGSHSWLAPIIPKYLNRIYIVLDQPITISVVKLWNYFKSPARGVKEFGILVDDLLVYNGILDKATEKLSVKYRSILFTNNVDVIRKERKSLLKHSIDSQGTVLTNDKLRMTTGGSLPGADQSMRPFTSVNQFRGNSSQSN